MAKSPYGTLEEVQRGLKNLNTDEEIDELQEKLEDVKEGLTGVRGEKVVQEYENDHMSYKVFNFDLEGDTAQTIGDMVEDEFRDKTDEDFGRVSVMKIQAPRKAVIRVRTNERD